MNNTFRDQAQTLREMMDRRSNETKVIAVTSGKGGVGKSSISVNLAIALSAMGLRVLVVDADFGLANVDVMLGVNSKYNLSHLLRGEKTLSEIIQEGHNGVRFISGGSGVYELLKMDEAQVAEVMKDLMNLKNPADVILFDSGAGINENVIQLVLASSETIVVTTPEPTAILDAYALIKTIIKRQGSHKIRIIMNKGETKKEAETAMNGFQKVIKRYLGAEVELLGYVLYDNDVIKSIKQQTPLLVSKPDGAAAKSIHSIAEKLVNLPTGQPAAGRFSRLFSRWF
ncbi:MAG: MinD/ParA family protein [Oscillospiraceae bacterium]|jgi:flagellar biosynthesis protein FlhG|nr:MinD/ParA family protein [Oscillospiraceae bacterium]